MYLNDQQLGTPQALYKGTQAAIEALTGVPEGAIAYATDNPDAPIGFYDGAAWTWVSSGGSGMAPGYLPWKHYARLATAGPLPTNTYDNTAGTITGNSTGILTVDGVVVALNDYVLVQSDSTKNGLYKCTTAGAVGVAFVLTRAEDMNEASEFPGATIMVGPEGTGFASPLIYECTNSSVVLGTTSITFNVIQARPMGAAGGELWGLFPSPTILNSAVIAKVLTGFSAGAGTITSSDSILQAIQKLVGNLALKLTANSPITGDTKTKITYDSNGLVTAGTDATTADIADSTNKRYVTDADLTVIGNTSGTNSGNETATTIGALIGGAGDATPNDSDYVATSLTAGGILKKITWTNVKSFLKTYWDTLYAPISKGVTNGDSHNHVGGDGAALTYVQTLPMHGLNGTPAAGSTNYLPPYYYGVNAVSYNFVTSVAGTLKNLRCITNSAQPGTGSLVFTVMKENIATAIVATVAAGAAAGVVTDTSNTVTVVAGDRIIVRVVNNASGAAAQIGGISLQIEINTG